jgi:hypothetical protein
MASEWEVSSKEDVASDLDGQVKSLYALPDSDPSKYSRLTEVFKQQEVLERGKRQAYLANVPSRVLRKVDPNQPAFSEESEMLRQNRLKSIRMPSKRSEEEWTVEPAEKLQDATPEYTIDPAPAVAPTQTKDFHPGQILDFVMTPLDPEMSKDVLGEPPNANTVDPKAPFHPGQIVGAIGDEARNAFHDIGSTILDSLSAPMTWMTPMLSPKALGRPGQVMAPLAGEAPRAIEQAELDAIVATRKHEGLRPEFPDRESVLPPQYPGSMQVRPGGEAAGPAGVEFRHLPEVRNPLTIEGSYDLQHRRALDAGEKAPARYNPAKDRPVPDMPLRDYSFSDAEFEQIMSQPTPPSKPVDIRMSKSGMSASAGDDGSFTLPEFDINDVAPGKNGMPGKYARGFRDTLAAMERIGPVGQEGAHMIRRANAQAGIQTSTEMRNVEKGLDDIFGQSGWWRRKGIGLKEWMGGENAAIHGSHRRWNITEAEMESIYNTMYSGGRIPPINERVQRATRLMFEQGTFPASSDPAVRGLKLEDPFTGKPVQMGPPSMFMPQTPINQMSIKAISDKMWHIVYERMGGKQGMGIDFEQYRDTIISLSKRDPEISSFKMKGLETKRLLDLEALGGSPYQWAKKLGYETDFYRGVYRFNRLAHLRGRFAEIETPLNELSALAGSGKDWMRKASKRALLNNTDYDMLEGMATVIRGVSEATDITMLQSGFVGNTTQIIYPIARAGVGRSAEGLFNMLTGADNEIIRNSGALLPQVLNDMVVPQGPLARFSSAAFKGFAISKVDRGTRWFAGHVGNAFIKGLEKSLLENPNNVKVTRQLSELGMSIQDIKATLQGGKIPDNARYEMIQNFANNTAGVTDVRGVPYYATNENPYFRLINKYKTFAQANFAEINRLISDAPNGAVAVRRLTELLVGAQVAGAGVNIMRDKISNYLMGGQKNPDKTWLRMAAENEIIGLGALPGLLLVQAANTSAPQFIGGLTGGPAAGRAAGFLEDLYSTSKNGVGWRSVDTLSKSLPIPFSPMFMGPYVKGKVKKEAKRTAEKNRMMSDGLDE